ncbi:PepSY domain-containing protein [Roseiflexus sp.]|uniref:PepSY domain-containing protein n=1 Tax=Roseiflexus sp. TaxID=2562120 RepID=UPI00398AEDBA
MKQSTLLGIAAAMTAFVLVLVGALAGQLTQPGASVTPAVVEATTAPTDVTVVLDPTTEALIREREAKYQQALIEAQQRLVEANRRIEAANRQVAQQQAIQQQVQQQAVQQPVQQQATQGSSPMSAAYTPVVTAEQAQTIASNLAQGATLVKPAELVLYQGVPAYEVIFENGAVYIDAQNGAVLANTLVQPVAQVQPIAQMQNISAEQAAQIAIAYRGGGQVREVERENEHGVEAYEVKFTDGAEVYVAASDGAVVYARLDKAEKNDDDDHEKKDDDKDKDDDDDHEKKDDDKEKDDDDKEKKDD